MGSCSRPRCTPPIFQERDGAKLLLERPRFARRRLRLLWADNGYWGAELPRWIEERHGCRLEVICRNPALPNRKTSKAKGFVVLPRRWVVERTFAWLGRYRRLSKDDEQNLRSSEAWIYLASTNLLLRRS